MPPQVMDHWLPPGQLPTSFASQRNDRRGLGAQRGRGFDHGHVFDFYTANLERKFGADWRARWREETLARLEAWGFNTIGDWSEPELWAMQRLPYTVVKEKVFALGGNSFLNQSIIA
jgi:hypothetical protein